MLQPEGLGPEGGGVPPTVKSRGQCGCGRVQRGKEILMKLGSDVNQFRVDGQHADRSVLGTTVRN